MPYTGGGFVSQFHWENLTYGKSSRRSFLQDTFSRHIIQSDLCNAWMPCFQGVVLGVNLGLGILGI